MGMAFDCDMCEKTIEDCLCFCNKCRKCLHPTCAGVEIGIAYNTRDGKKQIVLPAPEELPESCHHCLKRKLMGSTITDYPGSSARTVATSSSITGFLESTNESAHKLLLLDDCLIHRNMQGHELEQKDYGTVYSCFGCKEKGFGPHHVCKSMSCSFRLHKECKSPRTSMMHPFFPKLTFDFSSSPTLEYCKDCKKVHTTINCNACGMDVNGYFYHSSDANNHLHPCCANLPRKIIYGESKVTMVLQQKTTSKCFYCDETTVMVKNKIKTDRIWSYVSQSESENFHLDVRCIIKMLSALGGGSHLTLDKITGENSVTKLGLKIAAPADGKKEIKKWENKLKHL